LLYILSANKFFWYVVEIQHLGLGNDEPSADPVQIVCHIKGMLLSTVLKDVVVLERLSSGFTTDDSRVQGISSNW
jgi:hypothetical protein